MFWVYGTGNIKDAHTLTKKGMAKHCMNETIRTRRTTDKSFKEHIEEMMRSKAKRKAKR